MFARFAQKASLVSVVAIATLMLSSVRTMASSPAITSLSTYSGPVGALVTISGSGFGATQGASSVAFNGIAGTPCGACWSDSSITLSVPTGAT
jgi:IPT/TIG domain